VQDGLKVHVRGQKISTRAGLDPCNQCFTPATSAAFTAKAALSLLGEMGAADHSWCLELNTEAEYKWS